MLFYNSCLTLNLQAMLKKTFAVITMLVLIGTLTACWRSVEYTKPAITADHHGEHSFISQAQKSSPMMSYLNMRRKEGFIDEAPQAAVDEMSVSIDRAQIENPNEQPQVTWIGHATVLVQYAGVSFLTDPHLSDYASPIPFMGPKRLIPPALTIDQLPAVDFVLISHNHYDHLDDKTVKQMGNTTTWVVPLGLKQWLLKRDISEDKIIELDWWQSYVHNNEVNITATPSKHWSKRTPFDTNKSLWASWHIDIKGFKTWFAGDTGYDETAFKEIGNQLGPHDLALIPIGAYGPRYFMLPQHVDPQQAVLSHIDVQSKYSVGIHWGTFQLTHEPYSEPKILLQDSLKEIEPDYPFITMKIGQTQVLSHF